MIRRHRNIFLLKKWVVLCQKVTSITYCCKIKDARAYLCAMQILDGKKASQAIKDELKIDVAQLASQGKKIPHLAAILVGKNGASETYVAAKVKACEEVGFKSTLMRFEEEITELKLLDAIHELNNDPDVDGILVQLPLPKQISDEKVIDAIDPDKDVDGFHPANVGKMLQGLPTFIPATPYGIMLLLEHYKIDTKGKHAVVVGRSNIVGRPMSVLLSSNTNPGNCTVTICHSHTKNIKDFCLQADIIVAALGRPEFITADMVKDGAIIIDVGITRIEDIAKKSGFKLKGDVAYDTVAPKCSWITPVPGGVGPMTIAALMKNTYKSCINKN
jgi:methylenetetrahydrofolate dehydrogenase (NADP+) / methenyltetrahydrofolate cyclohydrolase